MSKEYKEISLPDYIEEALEDAELSILEVQADILELAESVNDYVGQLPASMSAELH